MKRTALALFTAAVMAGCASSDVAVTNEEEEEQARYVEEQAKYEAIRAKEAEFFEWMKREDTQKYLAWACSLPEEERAAALKALKDMYGVVFGCGAP